MIVWKLQFEQLVCWVGPVTWSRVVIVVSSLAVLPSAGHTALWPSTTPSTTPASDQLNINNIDSDVPVTSEQWYHYYYTPVISGVSDQTVLIWDSCSFPSQTQQHHIIIFQHGVRIITTPTSEHTNQQHYIRMMWCTSSQIKKSYFKCKCQLLNLVICLQRWCWCWLPCIFDLRRYKSCVVS